LLALAEMRIFVTRILWAFDIEEARKNVPWQQLRTFMIVEKQPIMTRIKHREGIEGLRKKAIEF
jgi:hypothetical protein